MNRCFATILVFLLAACTRTGGLASNTATTETGRREAMLRRVGDAIAGWFRQRECLNINLTLIHRGLVYNKELPLWIRPKPPH